MAAPAAPAAAAVHSKPFPQLPPPAPNNPTPQHNATKRLDPKRRQRRKQGGHGALTIALKNPGRFKSVSAFSPICNPVNVPWGQKAFAGYLGDEDREAWKQHDASELLAAYTGPK